MLIGTELFWRLLCVGQIPLSQNHPTLQKTRLGWIIAGRSSDASSPSRKLHALTATVSNDQLHEQMANFWKLEEVNPESKNLTLEERMCAAHFDTHTETNEQGRYVVKLPVKEQMLQRIGDSREIALKRFFQLERRFKLEPEFKNQYVRFIDEYLELGHMKQLDSDNENQASFYLPHHGVFKQVGDSHKLRVVFDASCKSNSGISLNDALMVGPVVQEGLISILMRFRVLAYVFTADIIKMYRQVLTHESQTSLQRIL